MTPESIIRQAKADGVNLAPTPAGTIKATGDKEAIQRWTPLLRTHKAGILAALQEAANETAPKSCPTCEHRCPSGACGDPVAAGLSDVAGVIRYSPDEGATCPAWLAMIPPDLEDMIRLAGAYWEYSPEDFDLIRETARRDPEGLRLALRDDNFAPPERGAKN